MKFFLVFCLSLYSMNLQAQVFAAGDRVVVSRGTFCTTETHTSLLLRALQQGGVKSVQEEFERLNAISLKESKSYVCVVINGRPTEIIMLRQAEEAPVRDSETGTMKSWYVIEVAVPEIGANMYLLTYTPVITLPPPRRMKPPTEREI